MQTASASINLTAPRPGRLRQALGLIVMVASVAAFFMLHRHALDLQAQAVTRPIHKQMRLTGPWDQLALLVAWIGSCSGIVLGCGFKNKFIRWFVGIVSVLMIGMLIASILIQRHFASLPI